MKQIVTFIFAMALAASALGQEKEKITGDGNNELKINMAYFVFEIVELNYERILMDEFSIGVGASYWFDAYADIDFVVNPFFRFYPINTRRRAATFFIEGNAGIVGGTDRFYHWELSDPVNGNFPVYQEKSFVRGGAGVAVGTKFLSRNHFIGEAYLGVGRIFGVDGYPDVYPRAGITFGKRF